VYVLEDRFQDYCYCNISTSSIVHSCNSNGTCARARRRLTPKCCGVIASNSNPAQVIVCACVLLFFLFSLRPRQQQRRPCRRTMMVGRCVWALAAAVAVLPHASDAQAYERLKAENERARAAGSGAAVGGGWGAGGGAAAVEVQPHGGAGRVANRQQQSSTTWTPPVGDPYTVASARFQAAEKLSPFTFLDSQPLKCASAFALASTASHPSHLFDTASCFDYCAAREDCGYIYVAERSRGRPPFCEVYAKCNRMHLVPSDGGVRGSIYSLAMRGVAEEIDGLWLRSSDEAETGWLPDDGSDPVLQELLVRACVRTCIRVCGAATFCPCNRCCEPCQSTCAFE
jgi:hypothetical protein